MAAGDKPPARKRPARKAAAKRARKVQPTAADRAEAAAQIATVTPIKGGTTSQRGRHNAGKKGTGRHAPTSPESLAIHERREMALNLRRMGLQWAQVAETVKAQRPDLAPPKYQTSDAYNDAKALIDSVTIEAVHGVREDDLALLLALQRKVYPAALDGDLKAVDRMLKILDQRARYLGLYAPTRHELTGTGGGPIGLAPAASDREVFDAAWSALDQALGHAEQPQALPPGQ